MNQKLIDASLCASRYLTSQHGLTDILSMSRAFDSVDVIDKIADFFTWEVRQRLVVL